MFYTQANILLRKFSHCTHDVKIMLFNSYCSSMYCAPMWTCFNKSSVSKLRVGYNNAFRRLFGYAHDCSASSMFVTNRINTFDAMWRKLVYSCRVRLEDCKNALICTLLSSDVYFYSLIWKHWRNLLY